MSIRASEAGDDVGTVPSAELASQASADVGTKLQLRPSERPSRLKKPRLSRRDYLGTRTYHITLATSQRAPLFEDLHLGVRYKATLAKCAAKLGFELLAYCFMPDHVHVLLRGATAQSSLLAFVQRFKQLTGFHFKSISGERPWQQSFFDRVLRKDEDAQVVANYIFNNPREAGLIENHPAFTLRGGTLLRGGEADGAKASSLHPDSRARQ